MLNIFYSLSKKRKNPKQLSSLCKPSQRLIYIATLYLVKYICSKNRRPQEVIETNGVHLASQKTLFKIFVW